ncbi:uncharacterized protein LOC132697809 [Cylas formicarius]|uniref:uncharacterized protein LOC132697809 n=1 Tax=Cylas formicarius TaxID=197179 RepID=UPI0029585D6E|nr:uncharacterized protein LOC132697809 [Cylas formicarius]
MARLLLTRHFSKTSKIRQGYVVLVPEIGEEATDKNTLYDGDHLPEFNNMTIEKCRASIAKQTLDFEKGIKEIEDHLSVQPCQDISVEVFHPLEELGMPLYTTWGLARTLYLGNNTLMPTSSFLPIHERAQKARASKFHSKPIYDAVLNELSQEKTRSFEENRLLKKFSTEGKLNGLGLDDKKRDALNYYLSKLAKERHSFKWKIDYATKKFVHVVTDYNIVKHFPSSLQKAIAVDPNNALNGPWKFNLQPLVFKSLMEYCPDREMRWNLWHAQVGRGCSLNEKELRTGVNVDEIRYLRKEIAKILGYNSYVDMSLETKMARSLGEIKQFMAQLYERSRPAQEEDLGNLLEYAHNEGFKGAKLELWDVPYWKRKQISNLFDYNEDNLKKYFPLKKVLQGLMQLCENLYNIVIKPRSGVSTWHKDVVFYDVFESHSSAPVGSFYIDPYSRVEDKFNSNSFGWTVGIQNRSKITNSNPICALIFYFEKFNKYNDALLTVKEIEVLFNQFGRAMQLVLTRANSCELAGLTNVEWDVSEVCGDVMSHWLFNKQVIASISSHCDNGEKLTDLMSENLCRAQKHMVSIDLSYELYLSALDLELYSTNDFWLDIQKRLWPYYMSIPLQKVDSQPLSFSEIFAGEWPAAYYSHLWSKMLAADIYSAFYDAKGDEQKLKDVGRRFRDTFLALGGSQMASQTFREFRGRDPSPKALLKSLGLKKVNQER